MHAIAVGNGTITIITDDDVHNIGPGNGIETESFNGLNSVQVDANITNRGGAGVFDATFGNGTALVTLSANVTNGTVYNITTTNFGGIPAGDGVFAGAFGAGNQTAEVLSNAPGNVTVINGGFGVSGIAALTTGAGASGQAEILMSGAAGGTITVNGPFAFNNGLSAIDFAGTANVTTNVGRTINVGTNTAPAFGDTGIITIGNNTNIVLANHTTIHVGNATNTIDSAGIFDIAGSKASVTGGNGVSINVTGNFALAGVEEIAQWRQRLGEPRATRPSTATSAASPSPATRPPATPATWASSCWPPATPRSTSGRRR